MKFEPDCHKGLEGFEFQEEEFNFNGKDVHIYRVGSGHGRGLLFLSGFNSPIWMYAKLLRTLSESFDVIGLDLPGFNKSEEVSEQMLGPSAQTQCVTEVASRYFGRKTKFVIAGHSLGAQVAARAASLIPPTRILSCVCFTPGGLKGGESFKNLLKPDVSDSDIFNSQKCRGIIETAGPEIGDHFYQFKLQMLGNGTQKFLRRQRTMAANWPWENDE